MASETTEMSQTLQQFSLRQMGRRVILILALFLLLWAGLKVWRVGRAANSLLSQQTTAETLMANGLTNIDPDAAEFMIQTIRQDVVVLRDEIAFLLPLMPRLGWVPKVGPLLISAPQLIEMADAGSETAVYAIESLKPLLIILQSDQPEGSQLPQLVAGLAEARPGLAKANESFEKVVQARANIHNVDDFPERLKPLFAQADEWLPIAQDSLAIIQMLPDIMGQNGRRTYILIAQNEDEIRATGGFISGLGALTLENGEILELTFQDASTYDVSTLLTNSAAYDFPPKPLHDLMGLDYLLLRDANYWPDFPYSAQRVIELYQLVAPEMQIDGLIAIDQQFMALLVAATGPIAVQENEPAITADNTIDSFRNAFNIKEGQTTRDWLQNRKAFLATFSSAIINKIESDFSSIDPVTLAKNMHFALSARHLQLYLTDAQETAVLDSLNWDGRLENPTGQDFLLVLDTNMGFNKTNMHIQREVKYEIDLRPGSQSQATVTSSYTHSSPPNGQPCLQETSYADAPTYQEIADQCYFNYLRIYAPLQTELLDSSNHSIDEAVLLSENPWENRAESSTEFANFTTFSNFMMIPRGESLTSFVTYSLAPTILQTEDSHYTYQLWLQKQAGFGSEKVTVVVTLPEESTLLDSEPNSNAISQDNVVTFTFNLITDTLITIKFQ